MRRLSCRQALAGSRGLTVLVSSLELRRGRTTTAAIPTARLRFLSPAAVYVVPANANFLTACQSVYSKSRLVSQSPPVLSLIFRMMARTIGLYRV